MILFLYMFSKILQLYRLRDSKNLLSTVDFQLSFLLYYACVVHTGLLILSVVFLKPAICMYYFVTLMLFLLSARFIDSKNFFLIYGLTYVEITLHVYLIYAFFGVSIDIELYYIMLIPVGCYVLLMSYNRNFQRFFIFIIVVINAISYATFKIMIQLRTDDLNITPAYKVFLVYNIFMAYGMATLQSYFFLKTIMRKFSNLKEESNEFKHQANYDALTNLYSRREMTRCLENALDQYKSNKLPVSLCMGDIDKFKSINDIYGHNAGDYVLKTIGSILKANIRKTDCAGRWGGEEFVLLIHSDLPACYSRAEYLRKAIENCKFQFDGKEIPVTITFGIAAVDDATSSVGSIIEKADKMLYIGKEGGRNQTSGI